MQLEQKYLSGTYCHETGTKTPSCAKPQQPTIHAGILASALKLSIFAKAQYLYRLGLIQCYILRYLQVRFNITFNCYGTIACIQPQTNKIYIRFFSPHFFLLWSSQCFITNYCIKHVNKLLHRKIQKSLRDFYRLSYIVAYSHVWVFKLYVKTALSQFFCTNNM